MLDVHPPHEAAHSWSDFLIHLVTITVGLLIALSLEGCVEWQHHRHLVHDAEASLQVEIRGNASGLAGTLTNVHKQQDELKRDLALLSVIQKTHKVPEHSSLEVNFGINGFEDVGWKTAQSTGAFSYMRYGRAQEYSDLYEGQTELKESEKLAAQDAVEVMAAVFTGSDEKDGPDFSPGNVRVMQEKIEVLQGQLLLVETYMRGLDQAYKKFLAAHPQ